MHSRGLHNTCEGFFINQISEYIYFSNHPTNWDKRFYFSSRENFGPGDPLWSLLTFPVLWGSHMIFRVHTILKQASVRLCYVSSLIWKQPLSISDYFGPKPLPWTTTEMAGDPTSVASMWGGKVDEVDLSIFSVPWMLMKRETCLAPLQVKHPEDFKIVSFFITVINLSVMWGNIVKNECLLLHSELLFQIQWDNGQ